MLHATKRLPFIYNDATNNVAPRFDRTVLPDGDVPPPPGGKSTDYGVIYGPQTPASARFRQSTDFGALWTFGVKGSF